MYKDVKKKLLSVALCICMIIGMVQVVPRVKAAATTKTIQAKLTGADGERNIEVNYTLPSVTYDGNIHRPDLTSVVDKTNSTAISNCVLTTKVDPKDAGTYEVFLEDKSGDYEFPKTPIDSFTIAQATIKSANFVWNGTTLALQDSSKGVVPEFSTAQFVLNDGITKINLTSEQYTVDPITAVGLQTCTIHIKDAVKKNFTNNTTASVYNPTVDDCVVAYDLSGNDQYYVAFGTRENGPSSEGSGEYTGASFAPQLGIYKKNTEPATYYEPIDTNNFDIVFKRSGSSDAGASTVKEAGVYSVSVKPKNGVVKIGDQYFAGEFTGSYTVTGRNVTNLKVFVKNPAGGEAINLNPATSSNPKLVLQYNNGKEVRPDVETVQDASGKSVNCTFGYENATGVGTAYMYVYPDADSNYEGTLKLAYSITSELEFGTIAFDGYADNTLDLYYTKKIQLPKNLEVKNKAGKTLVKGDTGHYVVTYNYQDAAGNWQATELSESDAASNQNMASSGTKRITVDGRGIYQGQSVSKTYTISKVKFEDHPTWFTLNIKDTGPFYYNGQEHKPSVEVTYKNIYGENLTLDSNDITVSYSNNVEVGTARITVSATRNSNFTGSMTADFTIRPLDLADAVVDGTPYTYDRTAIQPKIAIKGSPYGSSFVYDLEQNKDYVIVNEDGTVYTGTMPTDCGTYTMWIQTKNANITNSHVLPIRLSYQISPANIALVGFTLDGVTDGKIEWLGKDTQPTVISALTEGTDYICTYQNCGGVGDASVKITATPGGNYTGETTLNYTIEPRSLNNRNIEATASVTPTTANKFKVDLTVADNGEGVKKPELEKDTDYTISAIQYLTVMDPSYSPSPSDIDALEKAGEYEITLTGQGSYGGMKKIRVGCGKDISDAQLSLGVTNLEYTYNAKAQEPSTMSLQLADGTTASLTAGDFTVFYSRRDGTAPEQATINAGKVYVTATGNPANGYYGTTTLGMSGEDAYYTIKPLNIQVTSSLYEVEVTDPKAGIDSDGNKTFSFANEAVTPSVTVSKSALNIYSDLPTTLDSTMCEITYGISTDQCINAGSHAIIVKGIGNYTGTIQTSFIITPMPITSSGITAEWDSHANYADGTPRLTLRLNGAAVLVEGKDYEKGITWEKDSASDWNNICVYKVTGVNNFTGEKDFTYKKTQTVFKKASDSDNPAEGEVYISKWNMLELMIDPTLPGAPVQIRPEKFTLSYMAKDGTVRNLVKDTDYTITGYGTNTDPGTRGNSVTVTGTGEFAGTETFDLTLYTDIDKADFVTSTSGSADGGSILYEGAKISESRLSQAIESDTLSDLVTFKALWTEEGGTIGTKNYTVKLPNGYTPQMGKDLTITIEGTQKAPYYYAGSKTITVRVTGELDSSSMAVTIGNNNTVLYEGHPVTPDNVTYSVYSVSGEQKRLLKGVDETSYLANPSAYADYDYTISFTGNTGIGLAEAHITGINDYSGYLTQPFKIIYPFSKLTLQILDEQSTWVTYNSGMLYTYNIDTEQNKPSVRLYYTAEGTLPEAQWELIDSSLYKTVYDGYERAGDAKILISTSEDEDYKGILTGNGKTVSYKLNPIPLGGDSSPVTLQMEYTPMYTGNPITSEDGLNLKLIYKENGYELVEGTDYRVQHENNINASTDESVGTVVINGMGNFSGSRSETFRILTIPISSTTDIAVNVPNIIYTGSPEKPQMQIGQATGRVRTLVEGVDYEIKEYWDGANIHTQTPFSAVGSYYVVIKGLGNYSGTREIPYTIGERSLSDGVEITFADSERCPVADGVPTCVYDGKAHEPSVNVVYNGITLKGPGQTSTPDYTLDYADNVNAGIATITITGNKSFNGTRSIEFRIQPRDISGEDFRYLNDKNTEFQDELQYEFSNTSIEPVIKVYDRGMSGSPELSRGTDYEIIYSDDNGDNNEHRYAGKVTMMIAGKGNYGGTKEFTYYIGEDISKSYTLINGKSSVSVDYNGLVQAPAEGDIQVHWGASTDLTDENGEKRYDIAYYKDGFDKANKVDRDQIVDAGTYYVAVIGVPSKGTYAKSSKENSCAYTINPRSIAPSYILVSGYDGTYYYTGQSIEPKGITVEDTDLPVSSNPAEPKRTVKLTNGQDYELNYSNNTSAGKASIIVTGKGNYTGSRVAYFNIISSDANGNNTWDGTSEGTGSISNGTTTIAAADIKLGFDNSAYDCMMYNGYERIPTVSINGISTNEFIITASNNVRPGIATLMITGRGNNFTGTIVKNYKIKADLSSYGNIAAIEDQVYTGYQITPHVTLTCGGNMLNQGSDYTVTYLNNTNVGVATVMATAANDSYYIGTARRSFNISNTAGGMEITGYASSYTYTGYAITPDLVVTMNSRVLNRGTDYVVSYSNNINVGTATMRVTGIGSYSGTKTINYTIEAKNIENCLTTAVTNYQYTGNTYTPNVTVTDSSTGKTLVAGTDYTITYSNNTNPGTASIMVTALSKNYTGSKVIPFKITSAAVSGLRTSAIKNNSMKLSWSAQDYADGYQICNTSNRVIATTSKNSYTVKGLTSCTTYKFKVRSYVENVDGSVSYGDFSTAVSAKTMLNTPKLTAKSTKKGKVTLTWRNVAKATGYEIYYSTKKNGIYTRLKTVSKSSGRKYVDSGLASGERYYYTIRAYRTANGVKTYSNYNTIKSVKVK